jgi:hypothetical protein
LKSRLATFQPLHCGGKVTLQPQCSGGKVTLQPQWCNVTLQPLVVEKLLYNHSGGKVTLQPQ